MFALKIAGPAFSLRRVIAAAWMPRVRGSFEPAVVAWGIDPATHSEMLLGAVAQRAGPVAQAAKPGVERPNAESGAQFARRVADSSQPKFAGGAEQQGVAALGVCNAIGSIIGPGRAPSALDLPSGAVNLQLRVREAGAKIDRLFLTPRPDERPR